MIEKAGVAKGSLYYIFRSKDELIAAYLEQRYRAWVSSVDAALAAVADPGESILAAFDALADYLAQRKFCGCPIVNEAAGADFRHRADLRHGGRLQLGHRGPRSQAEGPLIPSRPAQD